MDRGFAVGPGGLPPLLPVGECEALTPPWKLAPACQGGAFPPVPGTPLLAESPSLHAPSWLLAV